MLLLEHPHLSQTTPHLFLRLGWRYHTAQNGTDLPKQGQYAGDENRQQGAAYQSAKPAKTKDPGNAILTVERTCIRRIFVGLRICEFKDYTRYDCNL